MLRFLNRLGRIRDARERRFPAAGQCVETLEGRVFLSVVPAPQVVSAVADNRGQVVLTVDRPLRGSTVNSRSVQIFEGDQKLRASVSYAPGKRQITVTAKVPADSIYTVRLVASRLVGQNRVHLDGEFNGADAISGDGQPGGDYIATTMMPVRTIARYTTTLGVIDVRLFPDEAPLTVQNFLSYANAGDWDNTFFHRSVEGFILQGGGYAVKPRAINPVPAGMPVMNEAESDSLGNTRGTLAMAKVAGDPDSATNQWFFNLADNRSTLDYQNGGYTVFGRVAGASGLAILDRIASRDTYKVPRRVDPYGVMSRVPVQSIERARNIGGLDARNVIMVRRVAMLVDLAPPEWTDVPTA